MILNINDTLDESIKRSSVRDKRSSRFKFKQFTRYHPKYITVLTQHQPKYIYNLLEMSSISFNKLKLSKLSTKDYIPTFKSLHYRSSPLYRSIYQSYMNSTYGSTLSPNFSPVATEIMKANEYYNSANMINCNCKNVDGGLYRVSSCSSHDRNISLQDISTIKEK